MPWVFPSIFGTMFVQDGVAKQASAARAKQLADAEAEEKRIAACLGIEFGRRNKRAWERNFSEYLKPTWMNLWELFSSVTEGEESLALRMSWVDFEMHRALACEPSWLRQKRLQKSKRRRPSISDATHTFSMLSIFERSCMVDSLECFFFADPTFPKLGCPPFLGIQEKDKGGKEKEKSEDSGG